MYTDKVEVETNQSWVKGKQMIMKYIISESNTMQYNFNITFYVKYFFELISLWVLINSCDEHNCVLLQHVGGAAWSSYRAICACVDRRVHTNAPTSAPYQLPTNYDLHWWKYDKFTC